MAKHNDIGTWGEDIACETLIAKGYAITGRNCRIGNYEIDIIAMKGNRIIFVEVKTRSIAYTDPLDAVDAKKISRICHAADAYIRANGISHEAQFDIITVIGTAENHTVEHIPDAFMPSLKTYR